MALFIKKIVSFFLSIIMLLGLYRGGAEMKNEIPVPELNLSAEDITNGSADLGNNEIQPHFIFLRDHGGGSRCRLIQNGCENG